MKEQGSAIIIITHKLNEVMEISDRVTILRKGQSVETVNTSETNEKQLTELMVGRPVTLEIQRPQCENVFTRLKIVDLSVKNFARVLQDLFRCRQEQFYITRKIL